MAFVKIRSGENGFTRNSDKNIYVFVVKRNDEVIEVIEIWKEPREPKERFLHTVRSWRKSLRERYKAEDMMILELHCEKIRALK